MALFTLHPLSVTLATSFSVVLVIVLAGVEMLDAAREGHGASDTPSPRA